MDQNDADYYNKIINKVSSNDQHLTDLLKDQVQIIGSTISNFNSSITNMEKNNRLFETNFQKIYNLTTSSSKTLFNLELKQTLDEHLSLLTLIISEVNNELISLLDAILLTKTNQVHPLIITPREFLNELSNGLPHLPPSCSYVLPLEMKNLQELLSLTHVNHYSSENRLIFTLEIPLINDQKFNLFKLIPLPTVNEEKHHVFILPSLNYLALSEQKTTYTSLTNLDTCTTLSSKRIICSNSSPIYSSYTKSLCEVELILNPQPIPKSCDFRVINSIVETWEPIQKANFWLYVLPK